MTNPLERAARAVAWRTSSLWERVGLHVLPTGFDAPLRTRNELPPSLFSRRYSCEGVEWRDEDQLAFLNEVVPRYLKEQEFPENPGLSRGDAAVLYAMIRHHRPRVMMEAGSGYSTAIAAAACERNAAEGSPCLYSSYDPFPGAVTRKPLAGLTALHQTRVQDVDPATFDECDLLFIDSSHVVTIGSDVTFLVLEVLPRLKEGCLVHFHDILLPAEYWREWVVDRRHFWNEQYLVLAFLQFNSDFRVVWAAHRMQLEHEEALVDCLPIFDPTAHRLTSLWIKRTTEETRH